MWTPAPMLFVPCLLCVLSTFLPTLVPSERQRTEGVRCFSLSLAVDTGAQDHSASTAGLSPPTSAAPCAPFAPSFVKATLTQSVTLLSQLPSVVTSVLNLSSLLTPRFCSGTRGLSTAFSPKALLSFRSQAAAPSPKHGHFHICGTSRATATCSALQSPWGSSQKLRPSEK